MAEDVVFERQNRKRIQTVENSFGPFGETLSKEGRVLMGEGHLKKQGRQRLETKAFFLFNDILMYGSIRLNGRRHQGQTIIPLEDVHLEDIEDSVRLKNQWLICTPRKSFFVSASSLKEKRAWMEHIEKCRSRLLEGRIQQPSSTLAQSWIPNCATHRCMRCFSVFTVTNRRHHCRKCGFLVCNSCSRVRAVISNIHPTKPLRVCKLCHKSMNKKAEEVPRFIGEGTGSKGDREDDVAAEEEAMEGELHTHTPSRWLDPCRGTWG